ncbi:hypothetical protein [Stenotrophomonas sp.]|uniref:hypothetical protein n=1 Tax=Stenotrophomonas sp. TaxID=69392 RepID=UPI002897FFC8|nr:hypothetical protein [Stenotrophomonas sp.]
MAMQAGNIEKWQNIRSKGMLRFVVVRGILGWGLGTAVLFTLIQWLMGGAKEVPQTWAISFVLFPVAGIFWGMFMWFFFNHKLRQQGAG